MSGHKHSSVARGFPAAIENSALDFQERFLVWAERETLSHRFSSLALHPDYGTFWHAGPKARAASNYQLRRKRELRGSLNPNNPKGEKGNQAEWH